MSMLLRAQAGSSIVSREPRKQGSVTMLNTILNAVRKDMTRVVIALVAIHPFSVGQTQATPSTNSTTPAKPTKVVPLRYRTKQLPNRAQQYYSLVWGIDSLTVKSVESGEIIKFTYRVVDAEKAKVLNDKKNEPSLVDPRAGVKLLVPSLEKVG